MDELKETAAGDAKIVQEAHERFKTAADAESQMRTVALDDLEFLSGKQWPDAVEKSRTNDGKPCLTINRLPQFIRQVTNDQRQNRPAIQVNPVDDRGDVDTAKVFQGLIRHIEYDSGADSAYDTAFYYAVACGIGYFRIITEYASFDSFEQDIKIKPVANPFSVYIDPNAKEPDRSDMEWCFIATTLTKAAFKATYPKAKISQANTWSELGDDDKGIFEDSVRVMEYFCKDYEQKTLHLLSDGSVVTKQEYDDAQGDEQAIISTRTTKVPKIKWYKIGGDEILEKTDWLGQWIPIVPVLGDEINIGNDRHLVSMTRYAKDPQRMYNYWASAETEMIALAPRAPYLVAEGQVEGFSEWKTANTKNHAYLRYKNIDSRGNPVSAPQRNQYEAPVAAITNARMQSADDLKATTGIYDASLGAHGNEKSGRAILARQQQGQVSNFHFVDNLSRSLRHSGRILLDLIPKVYDTRRVVRTIGEDGEQQTVIINDMLETGQKSYALGVGKYDVTVSSGPSFQTKRQEAVATMMELTRSAPQLMQIAGDLMVKNMDWPGAQEIAERLKKTMPPELVQDKADKSSPPAPEMVAQLQQAQQMIEQLTQSLNAAKDAEESKERDLESRERIALINQETELIKAKMQLDSQESMALVQHHLEAINQRLAQLSEPVEQEEDTPEPLEPATQEAKPADDAGFLMPEQNQNGIGDVPTEQQSLE